MKLVFHFGAHKTGTSLIQKYMRDNQQLMHKNGVAFTFRSETDRYLAWGKPASLDQGVPALREAIEKARKRGFDWFVVSHENALGRPFVFERDGLYPESKQAASRLSELLGEYQPSSIFYIRSQEEFIESYYLQTVHQGSYLRFPDWRRGIKFESLSWLNVAEGLREAFGAPFCDFKDFGAEISAGQHGFLLSFFRGFIGERLRPGKFSNFDYEEIRNPSIGRKGLAIALAANPHLASHKERKLMRVFLQENFSNKDYPRPILLKEKEKATLRQRFAQENQGITTAGKAGSLSTPAPLRSPVLGNTA